MPHLHKALFVGRNFIKKKRIVLIIGAGAPNALHPHFALGDSRQTIRIN